MTPLCMPPPMAPWADAAVAEALHRGWTTDPQNVADAARLVAALRDEVPDPERVLDYGCGAGRLATWFDPTVYLGYDTSPAMIAVARREHPLHDFRCSLAEGQKFDAVLCNSVVQYQPDDLWGDVLRDVCERARKVALVETYDGGVLWAPREVARVQGGSGAAVYLRSAHAYCDVLRLYGDVDRRVFVDHPGRELALYVLRARP